MTELTDRYDIYVNTVRFIGDFEDMTHIIQVHMTSMTHRYGDMTDKYDTYVHTIRLYVWQQ